MEHISHPEGSGSVPAMEHISHHPLNLPLSYVTMDSPAGRESGGWNTDEYSDDRCSASRRVKREPGENPGRARHCKRGMFPEAAGCG